MTGQSQGQFEKALRAGEYLFHFHTNWTDGKSSLIDYCIAARRYRFKSLILLEHIRRIPSYDVRSLWRAVSVQQGYCNEMIIVPGLEAKVLPDGSVDLPEEMLSTIQVLGIAEHSFQGDSRALADALVQAFQRYSGLNIAVVWVHPGLRLLRFGDSGVRYLFKEVLNCALQVGIYIEFNLRYGLPPEPLWHLVPFSRAVVGLDAHSVEDVERLAETGMEWQKRLGVNRESH